MRLPRPRRRARPTTRLDDDDVLRAAYEQHAAELYAFAHRSLGERGAAEDAVQETFVRAWRAADRYQPGLSSLRTWLFAICRNVVIDAGRSRASRPPLATAEPTETAGTGEPLEELLAGMQVEEALRRLSEPHRQVLVEIHLRDRTATDVAAQLGIPVGTVRSGSTTPSRR